MSIAVQAAPFAGIVNKRELALSLTGGGKAPEQALKALFTGAMLQLELLSKVSFEPLMTERVWVKVSASKVETLRENFIREICEKILNCFSEEKAGELLQEYRRTGSFDDGIDRSRLLIALALNKSSILHDVAKEAVSTVPEWIVEIISAVEEEGIELPERYRSLK